MGIDSDCASRCSYDSDPVHVSRSTVMVILVAADDR